VGHVFDAIAGASNRLDVEQMLVFEQPEYAVPRIVEPRVTFGDQSSFATAGAEQGALCSR
jgi:hypothetical protein